MCTGAAPMELIEASISKVPVTGSVYQILWSKDNLPFCLQLTPEESVIIPIQLVLGRHLHCLPAQISAPKNVLVCAEACTGRGKKQLIPHTNGEGPQQSAILGPD